MASIRKRGNSYLLVVSMGYDPEGHRRKPQQKTVHPPENLTPKAKEKWLEEEAALFERQCKNQPLIVDKSITLAEYTAYWLAHIAPGKLAKSTLARDKQDIDRFLPTLGSYKLTRPKARAFPQSLCPTAETKELCDRKTALRKHRRRSPRLSVWNPQRCHGGRFFVAESGLAHL